MEVPNVLRSQPASSTTVDDQAASFWETRVLPTWLPILLCVVLGIISGALIAHEALLFVVPLILVIPATILLLRYPFAAVLIWIVIVPFFTETPSAGYRFMYWMLYRAMVPATLGVVLLSTWLRIRKAERVRLGRAELAMLLFLGLAVVNITLLTPSLSRALIHLYDRLLVPFCLYLLIRILAPTERDLRRFAWLALITVVVQSVIGIMSWAVPQAVPAQWLGRAGTRTVGTLSNPAVYTSTLIFSAIFVLQYAMQSASRWLRPLLLLAFGLAFLSVFLSFSRGSWLGGIVVWLGLTRVYPKVMLRLTVATLIVALPLAATMLVTQLNYAQQRLTDADTAEGRILQNAAAINMIKAKPWLGWGFGTHDLYDEQHRTRVGDVAIRYREQTSHNTYLLIMSEMGVFGLLLYVFPAGWWLMLTKKVRRRLPQHGMRSWHLLAALWLVIAHHFIVTNFMVMLDAYPYGTSIAWMALALIANQVYPYLATRDIGVPRWMIRPHEPALR